MKRKPESLEKYLHRLEVEAADELRELVNLSPSYYTTEHLLDLRRQWLSEFQLFEHMQRINMVIGGLSPFWFTLGMLLTFLNVNLVAICCFCLSMVFTLTFLAASFVVKKKFKSRGYLEFVGDLINDELQKRGVRIQRLDYKKNG